MAPLPFAVGGNVEGSRGGDAAGGAELRARSCAIRAGATGAIGQCRCTGKRRSAGRR
jgi:hypothetical protein